MSARTIRRIILVAVLALTVAGLAAASAHADAPDVNVSSPAPGQHPTQTGVATVDTATGHVTVDLTGGWSWPTHGKDCNTDRAGAGVAVNWLDPKDRGFHVAYFNINGGAATNTPGGADDFGVGSTGTGGLNPVDNVVHPTENDTGTGAVANITDPSQFASWRGGCGIFSSDTILVRNANGTFSYTQGLVAHGNFGKATQGELDSTGTAFTNPTPPSDPSLQGALLQHVYASTTDVTRICALTYDVHPGTKASANNGVGIPGGAKEVTAGDQAVAAGVKYSGIHNGDNSIQSNGGTPAGNTCPQFFFPSVTTLLSKSTAQTGDQVTDSATLASSSSDAGGTLTYSVYSDSTCTTKFADAGTVAVTNGKVPNSNPITFNTAGTYYWQASYSGDGKNAPAVSPCLDEKLVVLAPAIHVVKTADAAQVNAGSPIGFTVTVYNDGNGNATGTKLSDPLPVKAGLNWSIDAQGAGWAGTCAIAAGTLTCGGANGVTVPAGTLQAGSTYTVHITSPTNAATGGGCPGGSGKVDNTGTVTTTNAGSDQGSAETCVAAPGIHIVKTPDAAQVSAGDPIGFTVTVFNSGIGDATGVKLSDPLPVKAGLNWAIDAQGAGWAGTCAINGGTLTCGGANGVTVLANTPLATSTFTVHISSPTTGATGGTCPGGTGVVNNTGTVTTTNAGSDQASASTCVAMPAIHILKTADAAQVNAGSPIGFTLTVYNDGAGNAKGVKLSDPVPVKAGLVWTVDAQGAGWGNTCSIAAGILTCGGANGVTVPAGTTLLGSTFTVHISSPTTTASGGTCPGGTGVVNNTGNVTTTNDGSDQSSASTCVASPEIQILKTADAPQVSAGDPIGFTVTVFNTGNGDAMGVKLSDPLPVRAGLSWSIDAQGAGWAATCSIDGSAILRCGGANGFTVVAGTTQAASTFTVHVSSGTTAATGGVCPGGSGVVNNTGTVTTSNAGSGQSTASTCVAAPAIHILKTADAAQVNAGSPIGFTMTVYNDGSGDAKGVTLNDTLPANAGLQWSITSQGAGWAGTCTINGGVLTCGGAAGVTVPAATARAASSFTVHITSPTTAATGGTCPGGSGTVNNTGAVTTTNDGSDQSTASTCVQNLVDLSVTKAGSPASQTETSSSTITWTMVVTNNGPGPDTGVKIVDPMPAGNTFVSASPTQGSCTGGAILNCSLGTMTAGQQVTIILITKPSTVGKQTNTVTVAGDAPETNTSNNTASATVETVGEITPPVVYCTAVSKVTPNQLFVGRKTTVTMHITKHGKAVQGVRVHIKGPKLNTTTKASNAKGVIKQVVKLKKAGIMVFTPLASKRCGTKRIGVTGVFTPPVTG